MRGNPLLPRNYFIPDVEAHVFDDGKLYLFGSYDLKDKEEYCSKELHLFSLDENFEVTDHGKIFDTSKVPWSDGALFAPDAISKDGKYYLYFCLSDGTEGVAISNSVTGPYDEVYQIPEMEGIDPAIFIDDDQSPYIYWGQFDKARCAKLSSDMRTLIPETIVQPLSVKEHEFHEGSSMRKRNGIYYYVFADTSRRDSRPTCLGYATSTSPLGPFKYQGIIIDNAGSDPNVWNNHGSIECFNGRWYIFYHRSTRNERYNRRVCCEEIFFDENGKIKEVEMTSNGVFPPLNPLNYVDAGMACKLRGAIYIKTYMETEEALSNINDRDCAIFRYFNFTGREENLSIDFKANKKCAVTVYANDEIVATFRFSPSKEMKSYSLPIKVLKGKTSLRFVFSSYLETDIGIFKGFNFN